MGEVRDVDPAAKRLMLADGAIFPYDFLIVAAGSQTSYYGHDGCQEWAPGLKSIEEATNIRHKMLYAFEAAERVHDAAIRREWLNFVIVGAGATGVELAGAIAEIARQTLRTTSGRFTRRTPRLFYSMGLHASWGHFRRLFRRKHNARWRGWACT